MGAVHPQRLFVAWRRFINTWTGRPIHQDVQRWGLEEGDVHEEGEEEIAIERLGFDPSLPLCRDCAERSERSRSR